MICNSLADQVRSKMKTENELCSVYPIILVAWATPIQRINSGESYSPIIFTRDLPPQPVSSATYTYMDEAGVIQAMPMYTDRYLPAYCYVQYVGEIPPPPPGYRYIYSELEKDPYSALYYSYHMIGNARPDYDIPNNLNYAPFALTLLQKSGMLSSLMELPEGYLSQDYGVLVSNFTIELAQLIHIHGEKDTTNSDKLQYRVCANGVYVTPVQEIEVDVLDKLPEVIRNKVAGCIININVPKVDSIIAFHVRSALLTIPVIDRYTVSGWNQINGQWTYVHDSISREHAVFDTNFRIVADPKMSQLSAMDSAMGILDVSDQKEVVVPLMLFTHLGVMFTLFEEAGFAPRMLMFVNGKTGSLKTAVCSLLYNLSGLMNNGIPATFRDTIASIETKFTLYTDKILLVDDFAPPTTAKVKTDMNKLLEAIIRYFGDGKGKARSNVSVTRSSTTVPRGLCCITGEDTGGSQSSLLRCVLIDVANHTFKGDVLAVFQEDPRLWTTHFYHFVQYVERCFESLKEMIQLNFPALRQMLREKLTTGRTIDNAAYLCLTAQILLSYGVAIGWINNTEVNETLQYWTELIVKTLGRSEDEAKGLDPVRFFISTVFDAIDSGEEHIAQDKETFLKDPTVLGYVNGDFLHIWPDKAYGLVVKQGQLQRRYYPLSSTKTHAALNDAYLIKVSEEKRNGKTQINYLRRESFGERPRMLVLNKEAARNYLEQH